MKAIFVSMDRKIFTEGSSVRKRMIQYGNLFDGLEIIVFTKKSDNFTNLLLSEKVKIYPTNSKNRWSYIFDTIDIGKKLSSDYVSGDGPETSVSAYFISRIIKSKFNIQIHTDIFEKKFIFSSLSNFIRSIVVRILLPKADTVRVVSKRIANSISKNNITLKSHPIVLPIFQELPNIDDAENYFEPDEYKAFDKVFISVSRLEPEKNIVYTLKLFKELVKENNNIGLVIVGEGSQKEYLKSKTIDLGLEGKVIFVGWINNPWQYFKHADYFIQTSFYEGFGMSLFEAAFAQLPIISTDVGLVGDVLIDQESVVVIDNNKKDAVNKIKELIQNNSLSQKIATQANQAMLAYNMSIDKYLDAYKNIFI